MHVWVFEMYTMPLHGQSICRWHHDVLYILHVVPRIEEWMYKDDQTKTTTQEEHPIPFFLSHLFCRKVYIQWHLASNMVHNNLTKVSQLLEVSTFLDLFIGLPLRAYRSFWTKGSRLFPSKWHHDMWTKLIMRLAAISDFLNATKLDYWYCLLMSSCI